MINQTLPTGLSTQKHAPFGSRLKSAREALGMDRKEIAGQLRLHENMITMIEHGEFKTDIPMTFIRGYIRGYSKLLGIPDKELHEAMELMTPKPEVNEDDLSTLTANQMTAGTASIANYLPAIDINNIFMRLFTCLLAVTLVGLMGVWWHSHKTHPNNTIVKISVATNTQSAKTPDYSSLTAASEPTKTSVPATQVTGTKSSSISNQAGKAAFSQLMGINHPGRILMSLILFLTIITVSMRLYASPMMNGMASIRTRKFIRNAKSTPSYHFDFNHLFKLKSKIQPILILLTTFTAILLCVLGGNWLYKHAKARKTTVVAKQSILAKQQSFNDSLFNTDFATLTSPQMLPDFFMTSIKPYTLQALAYQLDQYLVNAQTVKFALTNKSTAIGQFNRKKHHRYRAYHKNPNPVQQQEYSNSAPPPYYTVQ